jgi:quercetin dioxygenase-like cupin family protein
MEIQQRKATTKGPADWFSGGDVFIDAVAQMHGETPAGIAFVRFSPGARTAWHSHSAGQTLLVTDGEARIQSRGEPVVALRQGDVAFTPGGEWHWHGAAPDRFMTHLAVSEGSPEWGDHVSDAEYGG